LHERFFGKTIFPTFENMVVVAIGMGQKKAPVKVEGYLMFSQRNNPYCDLLQYDTSLRLSTELNNSWYKIFKIKKEVKTISLVFVNN
jgi:hypothetical protein